MKGPGAGNPFWAAVEQGAKDKAAELGVDLVVLAPPEESDIQAQIAQVEDQLAKGIDALASRRPTERARDRRRQAKEQGVGVVFVDTKGINEGVTFIGTNNEKGAKLAADYICQNVEKGAKSRSCRASSRNRPAKRAPRARKAGLWLRPQHRRRAAGRLGHRQGATAMENILTGNPNIKAVFASNDNMALGAVQAIKSAGVSGQIIVVGFDANPNAAEAVLAGDMAATVAQNPKNMGAFGVENALKVKKGETIEPVIDTGTVLVTKENAAEYK